MALDTRGRGLYLAEVRNPLAGAGFRTQEQLEMSVEFVIFARSEFCILLKKSLPDLLCGREDLLTVPQVFFLHKTLFGL